MSLRTASIDTVVSSSTRRCSMDTYQRIYLPLPLRSCLSSPSPSGKRSLAAVYHSPQRWLSYTHEGLWLKIPKERSEFIPVCVKHGFDFHHAEKGGVMLTRWLPVVRSGSRTSLPHPCTE